MGQRSWPVRAAVIAAIVLLAGLSFVAGRGQANGVAAIVGIPASAILLPLGRTWQRSWNHPPGTTYVLEAGVHRGQVLVPDVGDTIVGQAGGMLSGAEPVERGAFTRDGERWVLDGRREEPIENGEVDPGFEGDRSAYELWAGVVGLRHVAGRDAVDEPGGGRRPRRRRAGPVRRSCVRDRRCVLLMTPPGIRVAWAPPGSTGGLT